MVWMAMEWLRHGKPSVLGIVTGMVAGLGTITPASGSVGPAGAVVIGLSAGVICYFATNFIKQALKIDDSLDVFPVHGVGGILGTLLAGIFQMTFAIITPALIVGGFAERMRFSAMLIFSTIWLVAVYAPVCH